MAARRAHNPEVRGSNPLSAIVLLYAPIAQSVEQRTENPRVTGSIPVRGMLYYESLAQLVEHWTFNPVVPGSSPGWFILKEVVFTN